MTIRDSLYFIYNDIPSKNFGIVNININSGMQEEYFAYNRSIEEQETRWRSKPYFFNLKKQPLKLTVSFAFENTWDDDLIRQVRRWLTEVDYYKPLIFSNEPEKIYYALCVDDSSLIHNSLKQGYIELNFRCNDAYAYSPLTTSEIYDWDESPLTIGKFNFSGGDLNGGVVLNSNNQITLSSGLKKWSDIPPNWTWRDLYVNP